MPRSTTSASCDAFATTATGVSAPSTAASRSASGRVRVIARCRASVAPVAANASSSSVDGIAVERAWVRVSTTDCTTSGTVSSTPSRAAAAA